MAIDEAMRYRIHERLEALLGHEEAAAVMGSLMDTDLEARLDRLEHNLDHTREMVMLEISRSTAELGSALRTEMSTQMRFVMQWTVGSILAAGSLGVAAGRLLAG